MIYFREAILIKNIADLYCFVRTQSRNNILWHFKYRQSFHYLCGENLRKLFP
jgi:hypothetical protein